MPCRQRRPCVMVGTLCPGLSVLTRHGLMDVACRWRKRARLSRDGVASHRGALRKALIWLACGDSNSGFSGGFRRCDGGGRWLARKAEGFAGLGRFGGRGSGHAPTYGTPEVRQGTVRWTVARTDCPEAQAGGVRPDQKRSSGPFPGRTPGPWPGGVRGSRVEARPTPVGARGPAGDRPVDGRPDRLPGGASRRARGVRLAPSGCDRGAAAWAGAFTRLPRGRQARPDLSRDKSAK